jgi:tetratricopeptide (TPR) repeat protein
MAFIVSLDRPARAAPAGASQRKAGPAAAGLAVLVSILVVTGLVVANVRPLVADVATGRADERGARGDWPGAIRAGEQAVALWPGEPAHRLALSWAYLQRATGGAGDPLPWLQQAEGQLLAARDLRPGDVGVWAALGELYATWGRRWDAGKLPLAHQAYRRATVLAPNQATLYTAWGTLDKEVGRPAEAAAKFRRAVDLDATDGYAWTHLGDVELARGRAEEALAAYRQAVHWQPDLIYAHLGLARCYWQLGRRVEAEQALARALALDPGNPAALALKRELGQGP